MAKLLRLHFWAGTGTNVPEEGRKGPLLLDRKPRVSDVYTRSFMVNDGKTRKKGKIRDYSEINSKIALMFIFLIYLKEKEKKYNLIVPSKWFFSLVNCPPAVDEDNYSHLCIRVLLA